MKKGRRGSARRFAPAAGAARSGLAAIAETVPPGLSTSANCPQPQSNFRSFRLVALACCDISSNATWPVESGAADRELAWGLPVALGPPGTLLSSGPSAQSLLHDLTPVTVSSMSGLLHAQSSAFCLFGHRWGEWYLLDSACRVERKCGRRRCGITESCKIPHQWAGWSARSRNCEVTRLCRLCAETETDVRHDWGSQQPEGDFHDVRVCNSCSARERNARPHTWGQEELVDGPVSHGSSQAIYAAQCTVCGCWDTNPGEGCSRSAGPSSPKVDRTANEPDWGCEHTGNHGFCGTCTSNWNR
jgi:hypothetical protein